MASRRWKVIYKITYPNGKIYIGQDRTNSANYFGSANSALIGARLHPRAAPRLHDPERDPLGVGSATDSEVSLKETEFIREYKSNDPAIGYNRWPKLQQ